MAQMTSRVLADAEEAVSLGGRPVTIPCEFCRTLIASVETRTEDGYTYAPSCCAGCAS